MAGEKFTLEIFADTKAAEAALKNFAQSQKALARELATSTPAQAQGLIAPKVTPAFQQGGQLSAQLAGSVQAGTISSADADALKKKYIASGNALVRAQLREVAGLDKASAARVQTDAALDGFRAAQQRLNAVLDTRTKAERGSADAAKKEKAAIQQRLAATQARARQELALVNTPEFIEAQGQIAASRLRTKAGVAADPTVRAAAVENRVAQQQATAALVSDADVILADAERRLAQTVARHTAVELAATDASAIKAEVDAKAAQATARATVATQLATNAEAIAAEADAKAAALELRAAAAIEANQKASVLKARADEKAAAAVARAAVTTDAASRAEVVKAEADAKAAATTLRATAAAEAALQADVIKAKADAEAARITAKAAVTADVSSRAEVIKAEADQRAATATLRSVAATEAAARDEVIKAEADKRAAQSILRSVAATEAASRADVIHADATQRATTATTRAAAIKLAAADAEALAAQAEARAAQSAAKDDVAARAAADADVLRARAARRVAEALTREAAAAEAASNASVIRARAEALVAKTTAAERVKRLGLEDPRVISSRIATARDRSVANDAVRTVVAEDEGVRKVRAERVAAEKVLASQARTEAATNAEVQAAKTTEATARRISARQTQAEVARDPAAIAADTELRIAREEAAAATRARAAADIRTVARERAAASTASPFQRAYGRVTGNPVDQAPTGGQFFGRKLATTAGYGLSSFALFAAVGGLAKSVKEAEELDRVMNDIGFQLESFRSRGLDVPGTEQVRRQILDIAANTGLAADEVGRVSFQLQGAFGGDIVRSMRETAAAAEFVRISGLSLEETVDSFTALGQSFDQGTLSARTFGDTAIGLSERFGVLSKEILTFAADLAPVAAATGFTVQEIEALGAAAQKFSGRTGGQLAEAFGRIIPQVQERASEFIGLFSETPSLRPFVNELTTAFANSDIQGVFEILIDSYGEMSKAQQSLVVDMLGGRREAAALIGVLENGDEVLAEWNGTFNDSGKQAERFAALNETLSQRLAKFGEELSQLGIAIFESGFKQFLESILELGTGVVGVISGISSAFTILNGAIPGGPGSAFEGLPGKILATVAALKLLQAAGNTALAGRLFGGALAGGGAALTAPRAPGAFQGLFAGPAVRANQFIAANESTQRVFGPYQTLSGRAPVDQGPITPTSVNPSIRDAIAQQGYRQTGKEFVRNSVQGLRESVSANKGMIAAAGLLIGTQVITSLVDAMQQRAEEQGANRVAGIGERLAEGGTITAAERQRLEAEANRGSVSNFQRVAENVSQVPIVGELVGAGINLFTGGQDRNQAAAEEARSIMVSQVQEEMTAQVDAIRQAGLLGTEEGIQIFGDGESIDTDELTRIVDKAARGETLNPREFQVFEALRNFIPEAIGKNQAVAEAVLGTQEQQDFTSAAQNVEAVIARYEAGQATRGEYLTAITRAATGAQGIIDRGAVDDEQLATALEAVDRFRTEISQSLLNTIETVNNYRTITSGTEQPQQLASELLAAISSGDLTEEDTSAAIQQYLEAQRAILDIRIAAADSVAEANRIARRGIANDPLIRVLAVSEQIGSNTDFITFIENIPDAAQGAIGNVQDFSQRLSELIVAYGVSTKEGVIALLNAEIADQEYLLENATGTIGIAEAARALDQLKAVRDRLVNGGGGLLNGVQAEDPDRVRAETQEAEQEAADKAQQAMESRFNLMESMLEDPVGLAEIAVARAQEALRLAKTPTEIRNAQAELNNAQRGLRDAIRDVYDSQFELLESSTEDPVKLAKLALARAQSDLARARAAGDQAAVNRALAAINEANRGVRSALQEVMDAQTSLLIAIADAAGNTVRSAQLALQQAQRDLRRLRDQDAGTAAIRNARAQVIASQAGVRDALLARRQDHYQFLYDMGRITTGQLVSYLQSLLSIPDLTRQQIQDIQLQIRNLRQELGQDFQFNLPTELALPTLFEVRRADQSGGRNFTDQRQVNIEVNVSSNVDLAQLESVLATSVGQNVNGTIPRRY